MELTFNELINSIKGEIVAGNAQEDFNDLCIDTRKIKEGNVFLAIKGENFNGNDFVLEAFEKGAKIAIVDEVNFDKDYINGTVIKVKNTQDALSDLAKYYKNKLGVKVVGVTGSTGKTSTKDLISALLSEKYSVFKTKGNFNNEIGLPLMILELTKDYDIAVLEMGMTNLGDVHYLANIANPDVAVITNIGLSHLENLKTQDNIFKAKMEIVDFFTEKNILVVNGEDERLKKLSSNEFKVKKIGYNQEYDVYASNIILKEDSTEFTANLENDKERFCLPMAGKHNVLNAMLAIEVANSFGVTLKEMVKGLDNLEATSMRLQVLKKDRITIINDCYNASPDSMKSSLDVLSSYKNGRKIAILGDMFELGTESEKSHFDIGKYAAAKVDFLIAVGKNIDQYSKGYVRENIKIYTSKEECLKELNTIINDNDVILVKASRGMKFEVLVEALEQL